jgi:hypothetical protein
MVPAGAPLPQISQLSFRGPAEWGPRRKVTGVPANTSTNAVEMISETVPTSFRAGVPEIMGRAPVGGRGTARP